MKIKIKLHSIEFLNVILRLLKTRNQYLKFNFNLLNIPYIFKILNMPIKSHLK